MTQNVQNKNRKWLTYGKRSVQASKQAYTRTDAMKSH